MNWTDYRTHPALRDFVPLEEGRTRMLVRRGYESEAAKLGLDGSPEGTGERVEGGRARHPVVRLRGGERAVVRAYRRGGLVRHLNRERYFLGHRAFEELRVTERAARAKVRVPEVVAAAETRRGLGYTATLATRLVEGARELSAWLSGAERVSRARTLREAGRQIGRMHGAGIRHPDLNLRNFLVAGGAESDMPVVYVLDFDRARAGSGPLGTRHRAGDLHRLGRSARKLGLELQPEDWEALAWGYGAGWPFAIPSAG